MKAEVPLRDKLRALRSRYPDAWPTNYKLGMWAALLHRVTGLYLVGYVMFHLVEVALSLFGPGFFDTFFGWGYTWWMPLLDLVLMAALIYHGLNGLRLILMDVGIGVRRFKLAFLVAMVAALALYVILARDIIRFLARFETL